MAKGDKSTKPTSPKEDPPKKTSPPKPTFDPTQATGWFRPPDPKADYEIHLFVAGKSACQKYTSIDETWTPAQRDPEKNDDCAACFSQQHIVLGTPR